MPRRERGLPPCAAAAAACSGWRSNVLPKSPPGAFAGGREEPVCCRAWSTVNARALRLAVRVARTQGEKSRIIRYRCCRLLEGALMFPWASSVPRRAPLVCLPRPGLQRAAELPSSPCSVEGGFIPTRMYRGCSRDRGLPTRTAPNRPHSRSCGQQCCVLSPEPPASRKVHKRVVERAPGSGLGAHGAPGSVSGCGSAVGIQGGRGKARENHSPYGRRRKQSWPCLCHLLNPLTSA